MFLSFPPSIVQSERAESVASEDGIEGVVSLPGGITHDGAVVIAGDRIVAASCVLPLTDRELSDSQLGTRHRAALAGWRAARRSRRRRPRRLRLR